MKKGDRVRFKCSLGTMASADAVKFNGQVNAGDEGLYVGPHPNRKLKGWYLATAQDGSVVPMSRNQFARIEGEASDRSGQGLAMKFDRRRER